MSRSTPPESFGTRLRQLREQADISQSDLARRAGMQPSAIAHFEADRRKPSFDNIRALARALEIPSDRLFGKEATTVFRDEDKLSLSDRETIQNLIDAMLQKKK
ncbi:MAG: helix-turn-helix domain-containing protein [Devosia sp.]